MQKPYLTRRSTDNFFRNGKHLVTLLHPSSLTRSCSLAYHLARLSADVTVTLVDGRGVSGGATGRNGGLLWPW
jgi:hypothetical protein